MLASAESLWRLNQEYVNRLVKARNYLDLLEQLVRDADPTPQPFVEAIQLTSAHLNRLSEEHRGWCYTYFYESPETKRVVNTSRAVRRALTSFEDMRLRHHSDIDDLAALLRDLPRPTSRMTHVPNGDLWEMVQSALYDLINFSAATTSPAQ